MKNVSKNIQLVREILNDEIKGDVVSALAKLTKDYRMTWVYQGKDGVIFPKTSADIKDELDEVYPIQGRQYDIKHIAEGKNVVMVEMVESYPDPKTKKIYRTPLVIVLEMKKSKIAKGRHYCDPRLSYLYLTKQQVEKLYR